MAQEGMESGHPVDIYVHVKRETGQGTPGVGGATSSPGQMGELTSGQRSPPRPVPRSTKKRYEWQGIAPGEAGLGIKGADATLGMKKQLSPIESTAMGLFSLAKKWLPTLLGITTIAGVLKKSSLFGETLSMILDIISVMMDVILMPILLPLLQLIKSSGLIQALGELATFMMGLFGPKSPAQEAAGSKYMKDKGLVTDDVTQMQQTPTLPKNFKPEFSTDEGTPPKLQHGMAIVPHTMSAIIDPGERVLTAGENKRYLAEKTAPGATFRNKWNVTVTHNVDPNLIDDRVSDSMEREMQRKYRRS